MCTSKQVNETVVGEDFQSHPTPDLVRLRGRRQDTNHGGSGSIGSELGPRAPGTEAETGRRRRYRKVPIHEEQGHGTQINKGS